jgi:magnesium and cobalt transporter
MPHMTNDKIIPPLTSVKPEQTSSKQAELPGPVAEKPQITEKKGLLSLVRNALKGKNDQALRETIEEYIDEAPSSEATSADAHERALLANILKLRDIRVQNIMIPRANIIAIELGTTQEELLALLAEKQFSRLPVYRGTLDDVLGTIHIKDVLASLAKGQPIAIKELITDIPIVSPAMPVLDLMLKMRNSRRHMVMVVDEFGGIDGLVTIGDLIEFIVGEIEDEHHIEEQPLIVEKSDGSIVVDAMIDIVAFEERFGALFTDEDRADSDTLAGLVFSLAGRVPTRGEVISHHENGLVFEVLEADPRRVYRLRVRNLPGRAH